MGLTTLRLRDFRGFASLDLEFEPDVTVLVGVNGAGKTSILDAIALLLVQLTERIRGDQALSNLSPNDIRVGAGTARIELKAALDHAFASWSMSANRPGFEAPTASSDELIPVVDAARQSIREGRPHLPLAIYLPTNRAALDIPERIRTPHEFDALSAYDGALVSGASNFRGFFEWFREEEDIENEQIARREQSASQGSRLAQVRMAIERLFPGATDLQVERRPQRMTLVHRGVTLDVSQLSDGEKCLLAMAGDLARRMMLAAPFEDKPLEQAAVVLIDEIELHLHPGAQRTVLPRLRAVFPGTQWIVTTHSPQVLASVESSCVRLLENFTLRSVTRGTWRRDTNRILESAFDDPGRPPDVARKLNALRDAVDNDRYDEARRLIRELRTEIEGDDPDVFYLEQLLPPEELNGNRP